MNYAPVCDLASNPDNPGLGARSFGDDPAAAAGLAAATVRGLQAAGVAATAKHFPGKGDVSVDTHHELGGVPHDQRSDGGGRARPVPGRLRRRRAAGDVRPFLAPCG